MAEKFGTNVYQPIVAGKDTADDMAVAYGDELGRTIHHFNTESDRDAFTQSFKSRLFHSWCIVRDSSAWYEWTGAQEDGSDGTWNEIDIGGGSGAALLTVEQSWGSYEQVTNVNTITTKYPLEVSMARKSPDDTDTGIAALTIKPDVFQPMLAPSYLAYLKDDVEIVGKIEQGKELKVGDHHKGSLWFDDVITPAGVFIEERMADKSWGIQEIDGLDPNVSGGTDWLLAARIGMKGNAPSDGFVRLYFYNKSVDPFEPTGYLEDIEGHVMVVERYYKSGETLGYLDVMGIVSAKGMQEFSVNVVDSFTGDVVVLTDRTEGASGLMIQALTKDMKTGLGYQQYEDDTNQSIKFSTHYLGDDRATIEYFLKQNETPVSYIAGSNFISADGFRLINPNGIKLGVQANHLYVQDDGVHICDFNFGKVFSSEETRMMHNKQITVSATLIDKDNGYIIALMSWNGEADKYTNEIFTTRNNGSPVFQSNWTLVDSLSISEDVVSGDHSVFTSFTIPSNSKNYAVIIYPVEAQQPMLFKMSAFSVSVTTPFTGYVISAPELKGELHLAYDDTHKKLVQDVNGLASLRYTINDPADGLPMPVGFIKTGGAPITLDPTVNIIAGSGAGGGEGAIVFNADGKVTIQTVLRLANEQITTSNTDFWWSTVDDQGALTKLADSVQSFPVPPKSPGTTFTMTYVIDVAAGDRLALRAKSDSVDGSYLFATPGKPAVANTITFRIVNALASDDPDLISAPINKALVVDRRVYEFSGNTLQNIVISVNIPSDVELANIEVVKHSGTQTTSIRDAEYAYNSSTGELTVHVGPSVSEGRIYLEFWA